MIMSTVPKWGKMAIQHLISLTVRSCRPFLWFMFQSVGYTSSQGDGSLLNVEKLYSGTATKGETFWKHQKLL